VHAYLKSLQQKPQLAADGDSLRMEIDYTIEDKLLLTVAPDGFLKRV
jgi:cephalosporin hydroxylase